MPGTDAIQNSTGVKSEGHFISTRNLDRGVRQQLGKLFDVQGGRIHHSQEPARLRTRTDVRFLWLG